MLYDLIRLKALDLEPLFRNEQRKWQETISKIHHELTNWEMEHVGEQTFSKAFEPLINNIMMRKAKDYGLKKNTVTGLLRQVGNSSIEKKKRTIFEDKTGNEKTKFGSNTHFDRV